MSRELEYWRDHRRSEEILIAPTGGEIVWDAQFGGFDWESHNGVADNTQRSLQSEPLFVDLRGLQANEVVLDESKVRDIGRLLCGCNHERESLGHRWRGRATASTNKMAGTCDGPAIFLLINRVAHFSLRAVSFERSALGLRRRLACWSRIAVAKSHSRAVAVRCAMGCYRQLWVNASRPEMTCFLERY